MSLGALSRPNEASSVVLGLRIGRSRTRLAVAWKTALAMAGAISTRAIWPRPFTPSGLGRP